MSATAAITVMSLEQSLAECRRQLTAFAAAAPDEETRQFYLLQMELCEAHERWGYAARHILTPMELLRVTASALAAIADTTAQNVACDGQLPAVKAMILGRMADELTANGGTAVCIVRDADA